MDTKCQKNSIKVNSESLNVDADPKAVMGRRYRDLCPLSTRIVTRAAKSEDGYILVKEGLVHLMIGLDLSSTLI